MTYQACFQAIEERTSSFIQFWSDVCNLESPTAHKAGVDAVGAYFIREAQKRGWQIEINRQAVSGDAICITMNPDAKGTPVALSGHMDTVHPVGCFGSPAVRIEGDKIYGPGVTDCKGGAVAAFLAMDALAARGYTERPIRLILQSDEETSSKGSNKQTVAFMCEKAQGCAAFLNTEGHKKDGLVLTRKGIIRFRLTVIGEAIHSSNCADGVGGINAIAEAAHKLLELEKMKDKEGLTCNCGLIEGGSAPNTVPASCSFVADIRFATSEQMEQAERTVRAVAAHAYLPGSRCEVELISRRIAMEKSDKNDALLDRINAIYAEARLPAARKLHSNGGSDAAYVTAAGIPCVDSIGVEGGRIHSREEFAYLPSLPAAAKRMAAVILGL